MYNEVDTVKALRRAGKRTFFVTNNSSKSRRQYCAKLEGFGVHGVGVEDIVTSGSAIAGEQANKKKRNGFGGVPRYRGMATIVALFLSRHF